MSETERPVAHRYFDSCHMESTLDAALMKAFGADPWIPATWPAPDYGYDDYDSSFELWHTKDDFVPTDAQLAAVWALGFARGWICYQNGTEVYVWPGGRGEPKPTRHGMSERKRVRAENAWAVEALRDAAQALLAKLDVILPKVNGIVALQTVRAGFRQVYDGPDLTIELEGLRALLTQKEHDGQVTATDQPATGDTGATHVE